MRSRLFVGVFPPDEWRGRLVLMCDAIRDAEPAWRDVKWVPEENLHVTLAFFGEVEEQGVPALCDRLSGVAARHAALYLTLDAVRARPSLRRAGMIWAAFRDSEGECASLAADLAAVAEMAGSHADHRPFNAHVTLCRSKRPQHLRQETLDTALVSVRGMSDSLSVPSITLCESRLTPRGAVYSVRASWPLCAR